MKISKFFSGLFGLAGICVAISALWLSAYALDAEPAIVTTPESALEQVERMMEDFCAGDYAAASGCIYGTPDLGVDRDAADEVGVMIWNAFESSMEWEMVGECYATDSGLAQNIQVSTLDISAITDYIEENTRGRIEEKAKAAEDYDLVFDENDAYRESFISEVLREVTQEAIDGTTQRVTTQVTLHLVWSQERWWVVSNDELIRAVSGGIAK